MRILLLGYGRMGKLVEGLAGEYGCEVAGIVDPLVGSEDVSSERWRDVDVAIDFTSPAVVARNVPILARRQIGVVLGTTGSILVYTWAATTAPTWIIGGFDLLEDA